MLQTSLVCCVLNTKRAMSPYAKTSHSHLPILFVLRGTESETRDCVVPPPIESPVMVEREVVAGCPNHELAENINLFNEDHGFLNEPLFTHEGIIPNKLGENMKWEPQLQATVYYLYLQRLKLVLLATLPLMYPLSHWQITPMILTKSLQSPLKLYCHLVGLKLKVQ